MSTHHIDCAAMLALPASKKLVMLCLADGADKVTRRVIPGLENVMQWSGLKKSRTLEVIAELVADGLVVRTVAGQPGRMAEFVVFPAGCCALHGPLDVAAVDGAGKPSRSVPDRVEGDGSAAADPQSNGSAQPDPRHPLNGSARGSGNGSGNGSGSYRTPPVSAVSPGSFSLPTGESAPASEDDDQDVDDEQQPALVALPMPVSAPSKRRTRARIPADWAPSPELLAKAAAKVPGVDVEAEARKFHAHHLADGKPKLDWDLAFLSTWMGNCRPNQQRAGRPAPYRNTGTDAVTRQAKWAGYTGGTAR